MKRYRIYMNGLMGYKDFNSTHEFRKWIEQQVSKNYELDIKIINRGKRKV